MISTPKRKSSIISNSAVKKSNSRSKSLSTQNNFLNTSINNNNNNNSNILNNSVASIQSTNIEVHVRIRPANKAEQLVNSQLLVNSIGLNKLKLTNNKDLKEYFFDRVYSTETNQIEIYNSAVDNLLRKSLEGFNLCLLAYGQTGSGKTYTMGSNYVDDSNSNSIGIIPRLANSLFEFIDSNASNTNIESENNYEYIVKASFLELYNEEIRDLLCIKTSPKQLIIKEDKKGNINIPALSEHIVCDSKDCIELLWKGSLNRKVGSTYQNDVSSRSHAIFILNITKTNSITKQIQNFKISIVDLAGSEKLKKSGATGERMKEGISINSGLFSLSKVVMALSEDQKHIPFRDSKLTRLLKDSLGGNSLTLMIACISPCEANIEETINTLNYASFARNIKVKPKRNFQEDEVESLKRENNELKEKINMLEDNSTMLNEIKKLNRINKLLKDKVKLYENNNNNNNNIDRGLYDKETQNAFIKDDFLHSITEKTLENDYIENYENEEGLGSDFNEEKINNNTLINTDKSSDKLKILDQLLKEDEIREDEIKKESLNLKDEIAIMKERERIIMNKLEHAALILGEQGRNILANSSPEEDLEKITERSNYNNNYKNAVINNTSLNNLANNSKEKTLISQLQKKELELQRYKLLLEKHMKQNILNNLNNKDNNLNNVNNDSKDDKSSIVSGGNISNINKIMETEYGNNNINSFENANAIMTSNNVNNTHNNTNIIDNSSFSKPHSSYFDKLKTFQEALKSKILEAEMFKKKMLIEKNEEISAVKRNLTDKDKEIKKLIKINEKNEMMLEMTVKEIDNLKQEIHKRNNSSDKRYSSINNNTNYGNAEKRKSVSKDKDLSDSNISKDDIVRRDTKRKVSVNKIPNFINNSNNNNIIDKDNNIRARPPSLMPINKENNISSNTNKKISVAKKDSKNSINNIVKIRDSKEKNKSNTKNNSATNNSNSRPSSYKKYSNNNSLKPQIPCFIDTKEQFILSNISIYVKKLDELFNEKTKLLKKNESWNKERDELINNKTTSNKNNEDLQKQKQVNSKIMNLELKINNNNIAIEKIESEINNTETEIKENLSKMDKRINQMKNFIIKENEVNNNNDYNKDKNIHESTHKDGNEININVKKALDFSNNSNKDREHNIIKETEEYLNNNNNNSTVNDEQIYNYQIAPNSSKAKIFELEEKLVFIELENMCKDKRINELEVILKEKIDFYEEQLLMMSTVNADNYLETISSPKNNNTFALSDYYNYNNIHNDDGDDGEDNSKSLCEVINEEKAKKKDSKAKLNIMDQYSTNLGVNINVNVVNKSNNEEIKEVNKKVLNKPFIPIKKKK